MSTLSEALESISTWVQKHFPDSQALQPGLSSETIQEEVSDLPFELPIEVIELYLWRNGGRLDFLPYFRGRGGHEEIHTFFSLEEAVTTAKEWNNGWFPLFDTDGVIFFFIGSKEKQRTSLIFCNDELVELPDGTEPAYESLTSMILEVSKAVRG